MLTIFWNNRIQAPVWMSECLFVHLSVCLSCPLLRMSVCLSPCLSLCPESISKPELFFRFPKLNQLTIFVYSKLKVKVKIYIFCCKWRSCKSIIKWVRPSNYDDLLYKKNYLLIYKKKNLNQARVIGGSNFK